MHIEIIVSSLPEPAKLCRGFCEGERPLARLPMPLLTQAARNPLLEHLHDFRGTAGSRFADQQMHMFGREHIADQCKTIPGTDLLEDLDGEIPRTNGTEKTPSLVAAKGDEMKIAMASAASQILGHRSEERSTLLDGKG
jgi:hypothetical protein